MTKLDVLKSNIDGSENYVKNVAPGESIETRWVRRGDRGIVYLSSQTACSQGCKMCWLTASGQTVPTDLDLQTIVNDARFVLHKHASEQEQLKKLHFNFMARGEFFANKILTSGSKADSLVRTLLENSAWFGVPARVLISTIMPLSLKRSLSELFPQHHPEIYYSLYTTDEAKRKTWFPAAMPVRRALELLAEWQEFAGKLPRVHLALIKGVNDDAGTWGEIVDALAEVKLKVDVNLIRYNPPDCASQEATDETYARAAAFFDKNGFNVRTVNRVGSDVFASCGMFVKE